MNKGKIIAGMKILWAWLLVILLPLLFFVLIRIVWGAGCSLHSLYVRFAHPNPVFFGIELGEKCTCDEYYKSECAIGLKDPVGSREGWLSEKHRINDRPYSFGNVRMAEAVEAKICRIDEFYGQDMALALIAKRTRKILGVLVAARCRKGQTGDVVKEIAEIIKEKHEDVVVRPEIDSWQLKAMMQLARRPSLKSVIVPRQSCQTICAKENFEVTIMGAEIGEAREPERKRASRGDDDVGDVYVIHSDPDDAVARGAMRACWQVPVEESEDERLVRLHCIEEWQTYPQSVESLFAERDVRGDELKVDYGAAFVYVLVMLHDYQDQICLDKRPAKRDARSEMEMQRRIKQREREKNAASL